jgi:D-glycerate 3-kinase
MSIFIKLKKKYLRFLSKEKIYSKSMNMHVRNLKEIYIPMAFWINKQYLKKEKTLFLGLSASQGSGKTTVAKILKIILKHFFKRNVCVVSIDDFYKTSADRNKMAKQKHPLFKTRGVPGTHDTNLIKLFFQSLKRKKFKKIKVPRFDKSIDDRLKKNKWYIINKKPQIVIFEGWCVGAKAGTNASLKNPINNLEKYEDKKLIWRKFVNQKLKNEYQNIFSFLDYYIFMKVPNFKMVLKWRQSQEVKLKKSNQTRKKIMTYKEIKRFVMFYQRITLQMVKDLSKSAAVVMLLNNNHQVKKVLYRDK